MSFIDKLIFFVYLNNLHVYLNYQYIFYENTGSKNMISSPRVSLRNEIILPKRDFF